MIDKLVWANADIIDSDDAKIYKEIARAEQDCASFDIATKALNEKWGIWMRIGDDELLVDPIKLTSSLFKRDDYYDLLTFPEQKGGRFIVDARQEDYVWKWTLSHTASDLKTTRTFKRGEYVEKVIQSLALLYQACTENKVLAYDKIETETIRICAEQARLFSYLGSHARVRTNQIQIEELHFSVIPGHDGEHYSIKIGTRGYETWCTHWDNDEERNRYQFEAITFEGETAEIHLTFDMSDTIIRMKPVRVLKEIKEENEGYFFKYDDLMLVEIEPNEFVGMPIIRGYCDRKQCVRELYQGFLSMAMDCPKEQDSDYYSDPPASIVAYNRIKSPMIENFLTDKKEDVCTRQIKVKHVLTICPDFDEVCHDEKSGSYSIDKDGIIDDVYDKDGMPIIIKELREWQVEIDPIVANSEAGKPYQKDWEDYHKRGLVLAHKLREVLSPDFDLWYSAPLEDKSETISKPILIIN